MSDSPTRPSLIVRVRNRADAASWREFYQFYQPLLMRYLHRLEVEEHTANDLVQEIFIRLLKTLPSFEPCGRPGRFRAYLWRMTYSVLVDRTRRAKVRRHAEAEWIIRFRQTDGSEGRALRQNMDEIYRQQILEQALRQVRTVTSPRAWTCFAGRVLDNRPASALASELGISTNAVYVYASRVLKGVGKRCAAIAEELGDEPFEWLPRGA